MRNLIGLLVLLFSFGVMSTGMASVMSLPESKTICTFETVKAKEFTIATVCEDGEASQVFTRCGLGLLTHQPEAVYTKARTAWRYEYAKNLNDRADKGNYLYKARDRIRNKVA